jgi:hypothetical protein
MGNRLTFPEMEERILQKYPEIKDMQKETDPMDVLQRFNDYMMENLKTAVEKEHTSELSEDEASAICMFSGCHGTWVDGRLRFENCGLYKRNGEWGTYQYVGR